MSNALRRDDALLLLDVQRDFLPGGSLGVPGGDEVVPILASYLRLAMQASIPIFASRDWHPPRHCSFEERGGPWPAHCVQGSRGAELAEGLDLPPSAVIVSKGTDPDRDAYSAFQGTELDRALRTSGVRRLLVGGLVTEVCVRHTVRDAIVRGYEVLLLTDAVRPFDPTEGERAAAEMKRIGAIPVTRTLVEGPSS